MTMKKFVDCISTGTRLPEEVAREVDAVYKTLPSDCQYRTKAFVPEAVQFEPGERAEVSIISSNSVDKTNEVVIPSGVDLEQYRKSLAVLWNHKQDEPPVASCQWVKLHGDTLRAKSVYPERPVTKSEDDERPWYIDEVWSMVQSGVLRAKSIGFLPRQPMREATQDELQAHPEWKGAGIWGDVLMLEYSVCPIGINNDALVEQVAKGLSQDALKALGIEVQFPAPKVEPATMAEVHTVEKAVQEVIQKPSLAERYKSDECVSKRMRILGRQTKYKGKSQDEITAIAAALCHGRCQTCKAKKKSINWDEVIANELDRMKFDARKIANMAEDMHKNRGRV